LSAPSTQGTSITTGLSDSYLDDLTPHRGVAMRKGEPMPGAAFWPDLHKLELVSKLALCVRSHDCGSLGQRRLRRKSPVG